MKTDCIETINYKGIEIETFYDESAESPNEWGNDDLFLVYDHRQFFVERKGFDPDDIFENMKEGKKLYDSYYVFPVYAYIHSGVALSLGRNLYPFSDKWDVSFKGFALAKRAKGYWYNEDKAYKAAEGLIETWNEYLSGQVYGYNSEAGSCWGFYGKEGYEQMISEAKSEIDYEVKKKISSHLADLKKWILGKVNIQYRKPLAIS